MYKGGSLFPDNGPKNVTGACIASECLTGHLLSFKWASSDDFYCRIEKAVELYQLVFMLIGVYSITCMERQQRIGRILRIAPKVIQ